MITTIDFDKSGRCNISVPDAVKEIAFLANLFFDNSISALKRDIDVCDDDTQKSILLAFLDLCQDDNIFDNKESICPEASGSSKFSLDFDSAGRPSAFVYNATIRHSGFWYAAYNIEQEIENQNKKKHIELGFLKFCDCLDSVLEIVRHSDYEDLAIKNICSLGFTEIQALAICNYPLTRLGELQKESLCKTINRREKIISCLNKIIV